MAEDTHHGLGQRVIATDVVDVPLLEVRKLVVHASVAGAGASPGV